MMKYYTRKITTAFGDVESIVREHNGEWAHFLISENSVDYLEYVAWLFDGNTPEEWQPESETE